MTLIEQIKTAQLTARKARDTESTASLTTLIGEAEMVGKNFNRVVTDNEVIALVKKFISNIDFTLNTFKDEVGGFKAGAEKYLSEKALLEKFLPSQMTEVQLLETINAIKVEIGANTPKDMGKIMGMLKMRHEGIYDSKMASELVKAALK